MIQLTIFLFSLSLFAGQTLAFAPDAIDHLPGLNISLQFKHYSGYLDGDKGRNLFYWFVESEKNASIAPLVLWLNGGPGCSSIAGLLTEHGPFRVNADRKSLKLDPFSWNKFANVLYIESPINVGFSFNSTHLDQNDFYNDDATTNASYNALVNFFQKYPQFKNQKLYVTGESYGGVYVPLLTRKLLENKNQHDINIQGMAVGNGALDLKLMSATRIEYAYYRDLVSIDDWKQIQSSCCQWNAHQNKFVCYYPVYTVNYTATIHPGNSNQCKSHVDQVLKQILPKYNMYNLNDDCNFSDPKQLVTHECTNPKYADYLNQPEVKKALHVHPSVQSTTWTSCNYKVVFSYQQQYNSMAAVFQDIIEKHNFTNIVLFNGDSDLLCNFILTQQFLQNELKYKLKSPTGTWMLNGKVAGMASKFENGLRFFTVQNAGHMVPTQKPLQALAIFKDLLNIEKIA